MFQSCKEKKQLDISNGSNAIHKPAIMQLKGTSNDLKLSDKKLTTTCKNMAMHVDKYTEPEDKNKNVDVWLSTVTATTGISNISTFAMPQHPLRRRNAVWEDVWLTVESPSSPDRDDDTSSFFQYKSRRRNGVSEDEIKDVMKSLKNIMR